MAVPAILISILTQAGAPLLKELIKRKLPGAAGDISETVIDAIAHKIDPTAPATVETIDNAFKADPDAVIQAVRAVEQDHKEVWLAHLNLLHTDAESDDLLQRLWRPFVAYTFAICSAAVIFTACLAILRGIPIGSELLPLISLVVPTLTLMAGVTGYYVGQRTIEKCASKD